MSATDVSKMPAEQADGDQRKEHDLVSVELNGIERKIKKGQYTGRSLKIVLGVPVEDELEQVIHHEFKPISNAEEIRIHGGEKFISHAGQGNAS